VAQAPRPFPLSVAARQRQGVIAQGRAAWQETEPYCQERRDKLTRNKGQAGRGGRPPHRRPEARPERGRAEAQGKPERAPPDPHARQEHRAASAVAQIYGFHSVEAALKTPRRKLIRLYATQAAAARLADEAAARGVETVILSNEEITRRAPREAVHQGVLLEARPFEPIDLSELPAKGVIVVLDQVTDPHNVGAILRTGAAFAIDGLVTTERHSPEFTGALAKSASGGLEHVPICTVVNLARALEELADLGYWRVGLDSDGPQALESLSLSRPLALVLGAEGKGLRRLTRENCDALARLDMPGPIKSLNVSNACAVALTIVSAKLKEG
jgi:23S rRNA (guanosine2251-2'-O)-methyltransferase